MTQCKWCTPKHVKYLVLRFGLLTHYPRAYCVVTFMNEGAYPHIQWEFTIFGPLLTEPFLHKCGTFDSCNQYVNCISKMYRGYLCFGLATIFGGMLYSVEIIQKSSTWNTIHLSIIVFKIARQVTQGQSLNRLNEEYYRTDLFCLQSCMSEVDNLYCVLFLCINK